MDATRVEGMNDHLKLPVTHMFMMRDKEVIRQVLYYLRHGHFERAGSAGNVTAQP